MSARIHETRPVDRFGSRAVLSHDAISIARVICILGVVYVHAWTGLGGHDLELARGTAQENLRWFLMEAFGRSAVPLLGLISGWLVAGSPRTRNWLAHVERKARTIVVPMIAWNVIALVLVCGTAWLFTLPAPTPPSVSWVLEEVFILTRNPDVNVQMPFLRDLFVCMVMAPMLLRMSGRSLALVIALAAAGQVFGFGAPLILRPAIVMFFGLGIAARRAGLAERAAAWPLGLAIAPFAVLLPVQLWLVMAPDMPRTGALIASFDLVMRVTASLFFWRLAWALAKSPARSLLLKIEPFAFLIFCGHLVFMWLAGPLLGQIFGKLGAPAYPVYLLLQPVMVLVCIVAIGRFLQWCAPGLAEMLSGGRLKARKPAAVSPLANAAPAEPVSPAHLG
ncbi:Acyltransferase family protein [Novosphingobium mathurense]|uniref:Acyltransferase family protein n=1 Tax=Novosphingobium mathurense TaxID=428990 RepID=A0A1U6I406_9SPHN|nr:Acyltransferase family protein [Novosphingobium mathurense]